MFKANCKVMVNKSNSKLKNKNLLEESFRLESKFSSS